MFTPTAMKYGLITNVMTFGHLTSGSRSNLGDDIQTHAVEHLYATMGIPSEHIVRLTWYLTSRSEYEAAGAGIGAAWKETLGRNFPPSTLLYIDGLVDQRAKVEIEVTAFVPAT